MEMHEIVEVLDTYPDKLAVAQKAFKMALIAKEMAFSKAYLDLKAKMLPDKISVKELELRAIQDEAYYLARTHEVECESTHTAIYEKLMSAKKFVALRTGV